MKEGEIINLGNGRYDISGLMDENDIKTWEKIFNVKPNNEMLTVKQYATLHSVDERTVRAWIAQKKIKAEKFGRDWMIQDNEPRPIDRRYVENPIRNRRKNK